MILERVRVRPRDEGGRQDVAASGGDERGVVEDVVKGFATARACRCKRVFAGAVGRRYRGLL
jgi:hypothetical protein